MKEESGSISDAITAIGENGSRNQSISFAAIHLDCFIDAVEEFMQKHNIGVSNHKAALNVANNLAHLTAALRSAYDDDVELPHAMLGLCRIIEARRGEPYALNEFGVCSSNTMGGLTVARGEYDTTTTQMNGGEVAVGGVPYGEDVAMGGVPLGYCTKNNPARGLVNLAPNSYDFITMVNKPLLQIALNDIMKWYGMDSNDVDAHKNALNEIVNRIYELSEEGRTFVACVCQATNPWEEIYHSTMFRRELFMDFIIVTIDNKEECGTEGEDDWFEVVFGFKAILEEDPDTIDMANYDFTANDVFSPSNLDYLDYSSPQLLVNDVCDYMIQNHRHYVVEDERGTIGHHAFASDDLAFVECLSRLQNPHHLDSAQTISLRKRGLFETARRLHDHLSKYFVNFHLLCMSMIVGAVEVWHHERASYFEKIIGVSIPAKMNSDGYRHGPDDYKGCHRWFHTHSLESRLARESYRCLGHKIHRSLLGNFLFDFHKSKEVNPHYDQSDFDQSVGDSDVFDSINGLSDRNYEAPTAIYYLHRNGICEFVKKSNVCTRNAHLNESSTEFVDFTGNENIEMNLRQSNWDSFTRDDVIGHLINLHPNSYTERQAIGIHILQECSDLMDHPPPSFSQPFLNEMIKCLRKRGTFVLASNTYRIFKCSSMRLHKLIQDFEDESLFV